MMVLGYPTHERAINHATEAARLTGYRHRVYKSIVVERWCLVPLAEPIRAPAPSTPRP